MGKVIKSLNIIISLTLIFSAIGVAFIALPVFGNQALIVRSGSMEPQVGVGSIVVIRQPASLASPLPGSTPIYSIGDIVAFKSDRSSKTITTHRIVWIEVSSGQVLYTTKGDANEEADQSQVNQRNVLGRSFLTIPTIGRALAFAKSREGLPFLIILPAAIVILLELVHIIREFRKEKKRKIDTQVLRYHLTKSTSRPNWIGLKVLVPALVLGLSIPNSLAYLSDTETSANNTITAWTTNTSSIPQTGPQEIPLPPANIADHLVINEVGFDPSNTSACGSELTSEWVELYNPTTTGINLSGWKIFDNNNSDNLPAVTLNAGQYAIVTNCDQSAFAGIFSIPIGTLYIDLGSSIGNGLANGGDTVGLVSNSTTIDQISFGTNADAGFSVTAVVSGHSIERNPHGVDTDSASDWVDRATPTPGN